MPRQVIIVCNETIVRSDSNRCSRRSILIDACLSTCRLLYVKATCRSTQRHGAIARPNRGRVGEGLAFWFTLWLSTCLTVWPRVKSALLCTQHHNRIIYFYYICIGARICKSSSGLRLLFLEDERCKHIGTFWQEQHYCPFDHFRHVVRQDIYMLVFGTNTEHKS